MKVGFPWGDQCSHFVFYGLGNYIGQLLNSTVGLRLLAPDRPSGRQIAPPATLVPQGVGSHSPGVLLKPTSRIKAGAQRLV